MLYSTSSEITRLRETSSNESQGRFRENSEHQVHQRMLSLKRKLNESSISQANTKIPRVDAATQTNPLSREALQQLMQQAIRNDEYCDQCRSLNFNNILKTDVKKCDRTFGVKICALSFLRGRTGCRMCEFFHQVRSHADESEVVLRATSATRFFGINQSRMAEDTVLLLVLGKRQHQSLKDPLKVISPVTLGDNQLSVKKIDENRIEYSVIKTWVDFCENNHKKLCKRGASVSGLRVIDCRTGQVVPLVDTSQDYSALSYVWGAIDNNNQHSILDNAPKTIIDAMQVTRELGLRYIWVDRYCIPQDDEHLKKTQLKQMGLIYSNASITIIAAAGEDPFYGLPCVSTTPRKCQPSITVGQLVLASAVSLKKEIRDSKWQTRGWTYQEAILSRRHLVFTNSGVYYQCRAMHCHEGIFTPLRALHISSLERFSASVNIWKAFPDRIGKSWWDFELRVREFSSRSFSKDADALDAFQGVLEVFEHQKRPLRNICGMPLFPREIAVPESRARVTETSLLSFSLTWKAKFSSTASRRREFPSWTWLGWKTGIDFHGWDFNYSYNTRYLKQRTISGLEEEYNLVEIDIEISPGIVMNWEQNRSTIERHIRSHEFPRYLHIRGWVFDIKLPGPSFDPTWEFHDPRSYRILDLGNANDFEDIAELLHFDMDRLNSTSQRLIGLIMRHPKRDVKIFEVIFLVFNPQINAFERLGCGEIWPKSRLQQVSPDNGMIGTRCLKKEVVRLG